MYNIFIHVQKMLHLEACVNFLENYQITKLVMLLNLQWIYWCLVTAANFTDDEGIDLPFNHFHHYENFNSCLLQNQLFPEHGKTCPSCIKLEVSEQGKVTTQNIIALKSYRILDFIQNITFHPLKNVFFVYHISTFLAKITVQGNVLLCLSVDTKI